jgi:hypothetical protein
LLPFWKGTRTVDKANVERLKLLLKGHEEILEAKRFHPEAAQRQNGGFRESFNAVVRSTILPILEEIKDIMVGKVESASIFHGLTAAGLKVKLDRWEDFERSLLFFGDPGTRMVRITHEGVGFGLLAKKIELSQITAEMVEEEAMKFLKRVFGDEQLRRPMPVGPPPRRRPVPYAVNGDPELVRV